MPGPILNQGAVVMCMHGAGKYMFIAKTAPTIMVGGQPILTTADVPGTPIPSCPYVGPPPPIKCVTGVSALPGSTKIKAHGVPVLTQSDMFMSTGVPPGPSPVVFAGQVKVNALG